MLYSYIVDHFFHKKGKIMSKEEEYLDYVKVLEK